MPLFLNVTLEMPAAYVAIIPMVMYVSGIFMAIVSKRASKCFGIKFASVTSCMVGIAGCLWMYQGKILFFNTRWILFLNFPVKLFFTQTYNL